MKRYTGSAWETVGAPEAAAWTSYTPTLTQSVVVTKTVTYAKYAQIGKLVVVSVKLDVTGTGTGANNVTITLPVTASTTGMTIGSGWIGDSSAATNYSGAALLLSTTTVAIVDDGGSSVLGSSGFTAALASGDTVNFSLVYEAA